MPICDPSKKTLEKHPNRIQFVPAPTDVGQRIDKVLGQHPEIGSRSKAESLISTGQVLLKGKAVKSSHRVGEGDEYLIEIPPPEPSELQPLDLDLEVLFEDEDLLVLNKPAGLVVHPAAGHAQDTLVNALLHRPSNFQMKFGENRPGIVHRLDKDTSGLLVVAKNDFSQDGLVAQFKSRQVHRRYQALILNRGLHQTGSIQSYLGRHPSDRKRFASLRDPQGKIIEAPGLEPNGGKWAKTHYKIVQQRASGLALVVLKLETGRTHQIRVHLSEKGASILADPIYNRVTNCQGKASGLSGEETRLIQELPRLALHAFELGFNHPRSGQPHFFRMDWPEDIRPILKKLNLWRPSDEL